MVLGMGLGLGLGLVMGLGLGLGMVLGMGKGLGMVLGKGWDWVWVWIWDSGRKKDMTEFFVLSNYSRYWFFGSGDTEEEALKKMTQSIMLHFKSYNISRRMIKVVVSRREKLQYTYEKEFFYNKRASTIEYRT